MYIVPVFEYRSTRSFTIRYSERVLDFESLLFFKAMPVLCMLVQSAPE